MSVQSKMTAIADEIRTLQGSEDKLGLDAMAAQVGAANTTVTAQASLLAQIQAALEGKAASGGVSLDVIAAAELPASVTDGQIVVIMDTTPSTIYVDTDEPASPAAGDVWVQVGASDHGVEFSETFRNGFAAAAQWDGTAWETCEGYLGINGAWVQFAAALPPIGTSLEAMSWEDIAKVSDAGRAADYFAVGDRKAVVLGGTVADLTLSGTFYCYIIGIDHNADKEGRGIHFQLAHTAATGGVSVTFTGTNYNQTYGSAYSTGAYMNTSATNVGGWESSHMRNTVCAGFVSLLPSELQAVLKTCTKYTDNTGNATDADANVTATEDKVWIMSEFEAFGVRAAANTFEQNYQAQYAYFAAGNAQKKFRHNVTGTAAHQWLRSTSAAGSNGYRIIGSDGNVSGAAANKAYGFTPCFMV